MGTSVCIRNASIPWGGKSRLLTSLDLCLLCIKVDRRGFYDSFLCVGNKKTFRSLNNKGWLFIERKNERKAIYNDGFYHYKHNEDRKTDLDD